MDDVIARAAEFYDSRLADILKVVVPNGIVMAAIRLVDVRDVVSILVGVATLAYTIWRWRHDK